MANKGSHILRLNNYLILVLGLRSVFVDVQVLLRSVKNGFPDGSSTHDTGRSPINIDVKVASNGGLAGTLEFLGRFLPERRSCGILCGLSDEVCVGCWLRATWEVAKMQNKMRASKGGNKGRRYARAAYFVTAPGGGSSTWRI